MDGKGRTRYQKTLTGNVGIGGKHPRVSAGDLNVLLNDMRNRNILKSRS
jgi:hypothetical protein